MAENYKTGEIMVENVESERMKKFFDELHEAEFGYKRSDRNDPLATSRPSNPKAMVVLLKRALKWKSHENLVDVCIYLGAESDERTLTVDGCKAIIMEDLEFWADL